MIEKIGIQSRSISNYYQCIYIKIVDEDVWGKGEVLKKFIIKVHTGVIQGFKSKYLEYVMGGVYYQTDILVRKLQSKISIQNKTLREKSKRVDFLEKKVKEIKTVIEDL